MPWPTTSRHERGYGTAHDKRRKALLAAEPLCRSCIKRGIVKPASIADHIIPKSQGGSDEMGNYQPLCKPCSDAKTTIENGGRVKPITGADGWPTS